MARLAHRRDPRARFRLDEAGAPHTCTTA